MRGLSLLFLIVFLGAVGVIAYQNQQEVTVTFLQWSETVSLPLLVGASYLLGMFSGWSVLGLFRRSLRTVTEDPGSARSM